VLEVSIVAARLLAIQIACAMQVTITVWWACSVLFSLWCQITWYAVILVFMCMVLALHKIR